MSNIYIYIFVYMIIYLSPSLAVTARHLYSFPASLPSIMLNRAASRVPS